MQKGLRIALVLIAALTASMVIVGTAASDVDVRVASTVTLAKPNPFHGHVSASRHACEVNRLVRVVKKKPEATKLIGSTHTNRNGRWSIPTANPNGDYRARVKRRRKEIASGGGLTVVCTADHSAIRHF
jgi:hypothetical protein